MKRLSVLSLAAISVLLAASLVSAQTSAPATHSKSMTTSAAKPTTASTSAATTKPASTTMAAAPTKPAAASAKAKPAAAASALVDLNSASKADLMKLPGVGEAISAKIVAGRPWANKSQLLSKNVVNKPTYTKLAPLVIAKQGK